MASSAPGTTTGTSHSRVIFTDLIGTAIEFCGFYIYATTAALITGPVLFPRGPATTQALSTFVTFGTTFVVQPIDSLLFGYFGDHIGRKSALMASLLVMDISTTPIGLIPGYGSIGTPAPIPLCILHFNQGIGLDGEWGGTALLITGNAPTGECTWFGIFPQLSPSIGFLASSGLLFGLAIALSSEQLRSWG